MAQIKKWNPEMLISRNQVRDASHILYEGKVKSSQPSLRETQERSWFHRHISVKLFWSQPMAPLTSAAAYKCAAAHIYGSIDCNQESFT